MSAAAPESCTYLLAEKQATHLQLYGGSSAQSVIRHLRCLGRCKWQGSLPSLVQSFLAVQRRSVPGVFLPIDVPVQRSDDEVLRQQSEDPGEWESHDS